MGTKHVPSKSPTNCGTLTNDDLLTVCWLCHPGCPLWYGKNFAWPTQSTSPGQIWYVPQEEMRVLFRYVALPLPSTADTASYIFLLLNTREKAIACESCSLHLKIKLM